MLKSGIHIKRQRNDHRIKAPTNNWCLQRCPYILTHVSFKYRNTEGKAKKIKTILAESQYHSGIALHLILLTDLCCPSPGGVSVESSISAKLASDSLLSQNSDSTSHDDDDEEELSTSRGTVAPSAGRLGLRRGFLRFERDCSRRFGPPESCRLLSGSGYAFENLASSQHFIVTTLLFD